MFQGATRAVGVLIWTLMSNEEIEEIEEIAMVVCSKQVSCCATVHTRQEYPSVYGLGGRKRYSNRLEAALSFISRRLFSEI